MKEYAINFEGRSNAININQLRGTILFELFIDYIGQIIDMYRLVATLNNNGFQVDKIINNPNNTVYRIQSNHKNMVLSLSISKDLKYQQKNKDIYLPTIRVLKAMSKNATVINNNIININNKDSIALQDGDRPNLKLIKGTKQNPSIKKLLKTKKGKIALCTILGFSIVAGSFIAYTVADRIETQKYLDQQNQYSYQQSQSAEEINRQIQQYQATKNNNLDNSFDSQNNDLEQMKMEYNQENYQTVR